MKRSVPFIVLLSSLFLVNCTGKKAGDEIKSVTIEAVPMSTPTVFRITCETFDKYYKEKWKATTITDKAQVEQFTKLLYSLKRIDSGNEPDVRVKVLLTKTNGSIDTVCIDENVTKYQGASYETSGELGNFVQK